MVGRSLVLLLLLSFLSAPASGWMQAFGSLRAADLNSLIAEYQEASKKVSGAPKDRPKKVQEHVQPILVKIGALKDEASLRWLTQEMDNGRTFPSIREVIPPAIVANGSDEAVPYLLNGMSKRSGRLQAATLAPLVSSKVKIDSAKNHLLAVARAGVATEAQVALARVLGRLDSLDALQALLGGVGKGGRRGSRGQRGKGASSAQFAESITKAFRKSKNKDIRAWLGDGAIGDMGSNPNKLVAVVRLIGALEVSEARDGLKALVKHRSSAVASAAIDALTKVGLGSASGEVSKAVGKFKKGDIGSKMKALDALAASGDAAAIQSVVQAAQGRDAETRAVAMGSLALAPKSEAAMEALIAGLEDRDSNVRSVALRAIRRVRYKPMVGALVNAFGTTKDSSFQLKILEVLAEVTGQNLGLSVEDWTKWWNFNKDEFKFPKGKATGPTAAVKRDMEYFGIEVTSTRLSFLIDISGSMREMVPVRKGKLDEDEDEEGGRGKGGTRVGRGKGGGKGKDDPVVKDGKAKKIDVLKRELVRLLQKLPVVTSLNILSFHASFEPWQKKLQPLRGNGRKKAIDFVWNIQTKSGTNVFDTLEHALKDKRVDTIYLLTDGLPSRGRITDKDGILREIRKLNRVRAVTIHTIAFGAKSDLLEQLAKENGGQYRFVDKY